jgi:RNA polymerase sigma-70 factor (ECF subfamily)
LIPPERRRAILETLPHLHRYARSLALNFDTADELVQDCLERALSKLHLLKDESRLRAWLFTVMLNVFRNEMRRARAAPRMVEIDTEQIASTAEASLIQGAEARMVLQLLGELPVDQREVLTLVALEDVSYQEAADILQVPIGTVMSRLARARERLRGMMDGEAPRRGQGHDRAAPSRQRRFARRNVGGGAGVRLC